LNRVEIRLEFILPTHPSNRVESLELRVELRLDFILLAALN
jgi:hypothetical protein